MKERFCKLASFFGILGLFTPVMSQIHSASTSSNDYVVAAYYENFSRHREVSGGRAVFSPSMIDPNLLTDIYYAFGAFGFISKAVDPSNPHKTGNFRIVPTQSDDQDLLYPQVMALKEKANNQLNVLLSIGGWNFNDPNDPEGVGENTYRLFSEMVSSSASRREFIDSAIDYSHLYGFDGIDIDWEYPGDLTRGGSENDFSNFIEFLKECKAAFEKVSPRLLLTYASPASIPFGVSKKYHDDPSLYFKWIADCSIYLDRILIMAYDYHGPFDRPKITGANAPLNRDTNPASTSYIAKSIQNYISNGVPANKIVLGLPTFGHSYGGVSGMTEDNNGPGHPFESAGEPGPSTAKAGFLAYFEVADRIAQSKLKLGIDDITNTAFGYQLDSQNWVSFDTPPTIRLKAQLALKQSLKGVVFWAVDLDEYQFVPTYPNIRVARSVFKKGE